MATSGCCLDYWGEVEEQPSGTNLRLDDVERTHVGVVACGPAGLLLHDGNVVDLELDADLHAIADDFSLFTAESIVVVGEQGTILHYSQANPGSLKWELAYAPTSETLVGVAVDAYASPEPGSLPRPVLLAVGNDVVVRFDVQGGEPELVPAPDGSWGRLNAVIGTESYGGGTVMLVGDGGVAWWVDDLEAPQDARRVDLGVDRNIYTGGYHIDDERLWLLGEGGLALYRKSDGDWKTVDVGTSADFVDFAAGAALTRNGELWDPAQKHRLASLPWARGVGESIYEEPGDPDLIQDPDVYIVGDAGRLGVLNGC